MEISLTKIPINTDKESIQKLYIEIHNDKATLSLPLSSEVTQEEYEKALRDFYNVSNSVAEVSTEAK